MKCEICGKDKPIEEFSIFFSKVIMVAGVRLDNIKKDFCNECYKKLKEKGGNNQK